MAEKALIALQTQANLLEVMSGICGEKLALRCMGCSDYVWGSIIDDEVRYKLSKDKLLFCRDGNLSYVGIQGAWFLLIPAVEIDLASASTVKTMPQDIEKANAAAATFKLIHTIDRSEQASIKFYRITPTDAA